MSIRKFKELLKSIAFPILSIVAALIVSAFFVMMVLKVPITQYFYSLNYLLWTVSKGSFGDSRMTLDTISYITPIIFTGVAHSVAFRTGLFNIGVEGQFIVGMLSAGMVGLIPGLPFFIHIPLIILGGAVFGGLWAALPAYLKIKKGINEVINTIMMNYIALYLVNFVVLNTPFADKGKGKTLEIMDSAKLFRFSNFSNANISIFIGIIVAIFIAILLFKTVSGYEMRAVGLNPYAAEYGGINIKKNMMSSMMLSGMIAGIGGALHVSGVLYKLASSSAFPNFGFDGMAVALLAKSNPIGCLLSSVLFGSLNSSSKFMQINGIPKQIVFLIQSIIITFIAVDYIVKWFSNRRIKKEALSK